MLRLRLHQSFHWRLILIAIFFFILLTTVIVRVFSLAIIDHREFVLAAERQHQVIETLPSVRGTIFAQDKTGALHPLAIQKPAFVLVASPKEIPNPRDVAERLATLTPSSAEELLAKLEKRDDPYEVLVKRLGESEANTIRSLELPGVFLVEESRRAYPDGTLAASLLGFVSYQDNEEQGEYGIERQYQKYLKGERGFFEGEQDAAGFLVSLGRRILNPPVDGDNVVLTIDLNVQYKVEQELDAVMKRWEAESGTAIVLEPSTGRVLAIASRPTFDPNAYFDEKDFSVFRLPAVDSQYELGSAFKPITMAAGIDAGVVSASTTYNDPGTRQFSGGRTVSNFDGKSHGVQTMTQVLEKSLNTGTIFVMERLGKDRFLDALERFGFGECTGIDVPGEVTGDISNLSQKRDIDFATASFGQGIAITPIQLAAAISAIANHGILMRPFVVEEIANENGTVERHEPQEARRVISPEAAEEVTKILVSVVKKGFDNRASVPGYFVAGKTGTAQLPLPNGRGYSDESIHTFIGYAPAFNPKFALLIQLNKPKGVQFASASLASPFQKISEFILGYYNIPPDERR